MSCLQIKKKKERNPDVAILKSIHCLDSSNIKRHAGPPCQNILNKKIEDRRLIYLQAIEFLRDFPGGTVIKKPPSNVGDTGSIPGSGRYAGEGNGNPPQFSCLENPMDRRACWATSMGSQRVGHD